MTLVGCVRTMPPMAGADVPTSFFFRSFSSPELLEDGNTPAGSSEEALAFLFLRKCLGKIRIFEVARVALS